MIIESKLSRFGSKKKACAFSQPEFWLDRGIRSFKLGSVRRPGAESQTA